MRGYITTNGLYCGGKAPSVPSVTEGEDTPAISLIQPIIKVYPNPTDGVFVLELNGFELLENIQIEIYSMTGEKVLSTDVRGGGKYNLSLSGKPCGIYLVKVISDTNSGIARIIKR